jgi:hypothetical protein
MKKTKKLLLLVGVALVLLTPVLGLLPPTQGRASAAIQGSYTNIDELRGPILDHQLYYFLMSCFYTDNIDKATDDEVKSWEWFNKGATADETANQQDATRGGMYDNPEGDCDNGQWISEAFGRFGFVDPVVAFCALSFTYNNETGGNGKSVNGGNSSTSCEAGVNNGSDSDGADPDSHGTGKNTGQRTAVDALLQSAPNYASAKGPLTDPQAFIRYYETLMKGCEVLLIDSYDDAKDPAGGNKDLVKVPVVRNGTDPISYAVGKIGSQPYYQAPLVATTTGGDTMTDCGELASKARQLAPAYLAYLKENNLDYSAAIDDTATGDDINVKCADKWDLIDKINPLDWLTCSLLKGFVTAAQGFDNLIMGMLCINESDIFGTDATCSGGVSASKSGTAQSFHQAWNVFRILALGALAIGGLIMIILQALGFELFDAYTIKKTLPRILVAAIGISLSWQILAFFVTLSNGLGVGIRALIYAPFNGGGINEVVLGGGSSAITALFAGGAFITLGALGLLSFIGTAVLAILIAFFILVVRNILVILLILAAPVAIAAYILPNTEKYFKTWWDWLLKALLVFPIITSFIAVGHVFAAITTTSGGTLTSFVAFAAYFAPYFLIPLAFRFAGGALSTIGGFANDRSRGGFDRLKKARSNVSAKNLHALSEGNRFRNNNALTRGFNRSSRAIAAAPAAGLNPTQWRSRYSGAETTKIFDEAEELRTKNSDFMAGMQDDRVVRALLKGGHEGRAGIQRELYAQGMRGAELDTTTGIAERMQFAGSQEAVMTAAAIQQASTGTGYDNVEEMLQTIKTASGGNRALGGKMLGAMRGAAVQSGRHDLGAAGFGAMAGELGNAYDGKQIDRTKLELDAFSSVDTTSLARGRGESTRNLSGAVAKHINSTEDPVERARYQAQLENFTTNSRDYGALARAHEVHQNSEAVAADPKAASPSAQHEYDAHRTPRFGDDRGPDNPNRPPEQK